MGQLTEFIFGQSVLWMFIYSGVVLAGGHPVLPYLG